VYSTVEEFLGKVSWEGGFIEAVSSYGLDIDKDLSPEAKASNPDFVKAWNEVANSPIKDYLAALNTLGELIESQYPDAEPL